MKETLSVTPLLKARLAGLCWLLTIITSTCAMMINGKIVLPNDAAATAANLLANQRAFHFGIAALLVSTAFYLAATLFVYELLRAVNTSLSLLVAFFSLVGCALGAFGCLFDLAPFILLNGAPYLNNFTLEQVQALTLLFLKIRAQANNLGLVFFGFHCLGVGCLILKSTFLPRAIGALMVTAGCGWLTFLYLPLAQTLLPYNMIPGGIGELSLSLWLLLKGIDLPRWKEHL